MNHNLILKLLLTFFVASQTFAQFSSFLDAPTRRATSNALSGTLEGIILETESGQTADEKNVTLTFLFTKVPSVFFEEYDESRKAIVLDFYDTKIGESVLDTIIEFPIKSSEVIKTEIDLNKDVAGLRPDVRDVVRIRLFTDYDFEYLMEEKFGVITLTFMWNKKILKKHRRKKNSKYWKIPLIIGFAGAATVAAWYYFYEPKPEPPCLICDELKSGQPPVPQGMVTPP